MDTRRTPQCRQLQHGECSTCQQFVTRRSSHAHTYTAHSDTDSTLCQSCYELILTAARLVLESLHAVGVEPASAIELLRLAQSRSVAVLVQGTLEGL